MNIDETMLRKFGALIEELLGSKKEIAPIATPDKEIPEPVILVNKRNKVFNCHVSAAEGVEIEKIFDDYSKHFKRKLVSNHGMLRLIVADFCAHWKDRPMKEAWSNPSNNFTRSKRVKLR